MSKDQVINDLVNHSTIVTTLSTASSMASSSAGTPPNTPALSSPSSKNILKDLKAELKHKAEELKAATKQVEVMLKEKHDIPAEFLSKALNENVGPQGITVEAAVGKLALDLATNPQGTLTNVTSALIGEGAEIAKESITTCCWSFLKS